LGDVPGELLVGDVGLDGDVGLVAGLDGLVGLLGDVGLYEGLVGE